MSTLGRAILDSNLLPRALTRRWMKPTTLTSSHAAAVGAPWEIFSFPHEAEDRTIDLYTKSGDEGVYSSMIALSPDHDVGFTILVAGKNPTYVPLMFSDVVAAAIIPALEQAGKEEANKRFSGTYTSATMNSSMVIVTDDGPGLKVERWISNSTDMFDALAKAQNEGQHLSSSPSNMSIRLYPTGLYDMRRSISFRAIIQTLSPSSSSSSEGKGTTTGGPFMQSCMTWAEVDSLVYGSVGVDEFVFELDERGDASSVSPRALRVSLQRQQQQQQQQQPTS